VEAREDSRSALAPSTRARLLELLGRLGRPVSTGELGELTGLHPNGVRAHLQALLRGGLVVRGRERGARGRPRDLWSATRTPAPGAELRPYVDLSRWLAGAIGRGGIAAVERAGRRTGRELARNGARAAPVEAIEESLAALGFAPRRGARSRELVTFRLGNCPYSEALSDAPAAVCALHRGITAGLLEVAYAGATLDRFTPRERPDGECVIAIRKPLGATALR
jgi:predicted ArsR family transcriptional regulator